MDSQWLSLTEYSSKYNVSISTLRRRIRSGQLSFNISFGKYFLKDQNLGRLKETKEEIKNQEFNASIKNKIDNKEKDATQKDIVQKEIKSVGTEHFLLDKLMDVQKKLYEKIEAKELKILEQQTQIADLNTLVAFLENENKDLKSVLHQEKEIEEWLELK